MAQHLLNGPEVRAVFQQMHRKGMAQSVGGNVLLDARLLLIVLDDFPETLTAHTLAVHVHEQGRFLRIRDQLGPDALDIILKRLHRAVVQGDDPLLFAVGAADKARRQVQVPDVQCDQLADSDAGGVQQLQHGMIPEALGIHALRLFQKQLHLFGGEDLRVFPLHFGGGHSLCRVLFQLPGSHHIAVKGLDGRQKPGDGSGGLPVAQHPVHIVLDCRAVRLPQVYVAVIM